MESARRPVEKQGKPAALSMVRCNMGLSVYYPQDIRNALLAAEQSASAALRAIGAEDDPFANGYRAGYRAALVTIALAFGLAPDNGKAHGTEIMRLLIDNHCPS